MASQLVAVITGASSGVGRATTNAFAREGASLALIARGKDGLEGACRDVESAGGRALVVTADVADAEALDSAAEKVETEFGPIDVWVNNAMATVFSPFKEMTPEEFRRVTEVTYLGQVYGTMAALKRMLSRDRGVIVQVGSALAYRGIPLQSAYCGAKHAIQGFTEAVLTELMHERSRVWITMVQLPGLNTPQFDVCRTRLRRQPQPVPPVYQPEVAAEAIVWASKQRQREVFVGGSTAVVITGDKIAPALGDLYLAKTGIGSQQSKELIDAGRPDNLFDPLPGDRGVRGRFDKLAHDKSYQFWGVRHKRLLAGLGAAAAGAFALAARRRNGA